MAHWHLKGLRECVVATLAGGGLVRNHYLLPNNYIFCDAHPFHLFSFGTNIFCCFAVSLEAVGVGESVWGTTRWAACVGLSVLVGYAWQGICCCFFGGVAFFVIC